MDILLYATAKSWQREMDRQGFDLLENNVQQVVAFMERIEESEVDSRPDTKKQSSTVAKKPSSKDWNKSKRKNDGKKHCTLHGDGCH